MSNKAGLAVEQVARGQIRADIERGIADVKAGRAGDDLDDLLDELDSDLRAACDESAHRRGASAVNAPAGPTKATSAPLSSPATKCLKCGGLTVRKRSRSGRTIRYRNMSALAVPADVLVPTCRRCHAEYVDAETAAALEGALAEAFREALHRRVRQGIDVVTKHISQRKLESLLGLSQGYLSRLRAGAGNPSTELVSHLALLAHDPARRIRELQRYWAHPDGLAAPEAVLPTDAVT